MKLSDKQIRKRLKEEEGSAAGQIEPDSESRVRQTIYRSVNALYEREAERTLSAWEFLYQQGRYIHKYLLAFQGGVLFLLWTVLKTLESGYYVQRCMGIGASLFAVLLLPELWKNRSTNAMEVECAARYSLRQIYSARILLCALADMAMLCAFMATVVVNGKAVWEEVAVQFFLPYIVTCCICFRTLYSRRVGTEAGAVLLCMVWAFIWMEFVVNEEIYGAVSGAAWMAMLAAAAFYLGYCIYKGAKQNWKTEEAGTE